MPVVALAVAIALVVAAAIATPRAPAARAASAAQLERLRDRITGTERQVNTRQARERVLTADLRRYGARIATLQQRVGRIQARERVVARRLARSAAVLERTQRKLRTQRQRLVRLRAQLAHARRVLAARLVALYQADTPGLIDVVVSSRGFVDLLERAEFAARVGRQDQRIISAVRAARSRTVVLERRLAKAERTRRRTTARIRASRDEIAHGKDRMIGAREAVEEARASRAGLLRSVRLKRRDLEGDLASMRRDESRIRARLARAAPSGAPRAASGPTARAAGGPLAWPVDGQLTSPFGQRWGRLHAGIDIAVPTGTPVRAARAGTVAISGWTGGYGNYVCVDLGGGLSACGAHNSQLKVRVGQRVTKGQVIALSGNTGNSTGPHVHFETRLGGTPRDPMDYL